ncbi:MAG TPA: hypothetical protein VEB19_04095 [Gemmatimonadaceae bacterium]|nr:hypothetical protein [Gemmatimonadaceae bacterium]
MGTSSSALNQSDSPLSDDDLFERGQLSLLEIIAFVRRNVRTIAGMAIGAFLLVVIAVVLMERTYTSSASFTPQSSDRLSAVAGLAAQFGVAAGGPDPSESPAFYAELLKTREVMTAVLEAKYSTSHTKRGTAIRLIDLMEVDEPTEERRLQAAIKELSDEVDVEHRARIGIVSFRVSLNDPVLAQQVTRKFLDEVSRFSLEKRSAKGNAERRFTEARMRDLQAQLRAAEDQLQSFLQRNRDYRNSAELTFQYNRLAENVEFLRGVRTTVAQAHEKARMDEVRDTPVLTVIEQPYLPARPNGRGIVRYGLLALGLGTLVGLAAAFARESFRRERVSISR